jgi:signal transduction histidine kinase
MPRAHRPALVLLLCVLCAHAASAQDLPNKRVLLVYTHEREMDLYVSLDRALRSALEGDPGYSVEFFSEYLDLLRFAEPVRSEALLAFLRAKYKDQSLDLVVAVSPPAFEFVAEHGEDLFGKVPIVFTSVNVTRLAGTPLKPDVTGVAVRREFGDTVDLALQLQPEIREIVIPVGSSLLERTWTEEIRGKLRPYEGRVKLTYLADVSMDQIVDRVRALPAHAVVLFTPLFFTDGAHQYFPQETALALIGGASSVPMYGTDANFLGHGIIGGALYDIAIVGAAAGRMGRRILGGEAPERIPVEVLNPNAVTFDARQLDRWGVARTRLPAGSVVAFDQPSIWTQYREYIIGVGALLAVQSILISLLIVGTRRLKESQAQLNDLSGRLQRLTGGLLLAREEERARIAREIHDVLGQALTALKMDVAWLGRRLPGGASEARDKLTSMETFIDQTVIGVRELATDLRPAILDELGLAAAIDWQAQEFERRTGIRCVFRAAIGEDAVDPLVATALFRILQESLTNVARHSKARSVNLMLERRGGSLVLEVQDDGVGIAPADAASMRAIGLAGMRERAHLIGGKFSITGAAGAGTTVLVRVAARELAGA